MTTTPEETLEALRTRLARHVGASRVDDYVTECLDEAILLVDQHIGGTEVPPLIRTRALIAAGSDLYWMRQARNGIATFDGDGEVTALRISRDPLASARPILANFLGVGIA